MRTVSHKLLHDWLRVAHARHHDVKPILRAAGIPWRHYQDDRTRISGEQLAQVNAQLRGVLGDQFMGYGREAVSPALMDRVMIKLLAQTRTLGDVLDEWVGFWNLVQPDTGVVSLCLDTNQVVYRFQFKIPQRPGAYVWILDSTMFKLQLFSWLIGKPITPKLIGIAEPAPIGVDDDLALLPAPVVFGQTHNFLVIDKEYLRCPVIRTPQECLRYKQHLPRDFFAVPEGERCLSPRVRRMLRDTLEVECRLPSSEDIAAALSVSARGLRRKLETEGGSFQQLKDEIRRDLACEKLARGEVSIGEIAADLGFSGTAAFSRAFRIWTARTPEEYRIHLAAADSNN